ncbi:hypothetical protein Acr_00g0070110 [Actinidia rufa]|uniref:Retrovirus-related Pol polyprotein from transposon TNT 1-94-like beta-barrel domain-containing protein n=1 Tax=Actinidia rufa TaxID=165716 RepID=A0A7J0DR66_9ERIC|nr:hypothetical protein Acr_00g0070110 [Actinidia rufa]
MAEDESDVLLAASADEKSDWVLDSCSTCHLCKDTEVFSTYAACEELVWMANNMANKVVGKRIIRFYMEDGSGRTLKVFKGNKEMLWGRKTRGLYRLEGSVQIEKAIVRHRSSGISKKKNEQEKQPLHKGTQSKRMVQDVQLEAQRKETKKSFTATGVSPPKRVSFTLDLISGGDISSCVYKEGKMQPRQLVK